MLHLPMIIAIVAIVLWTIAHSPFILKFPPLALEFRTYVAVICGVYLLQWLALIIEIKYLELRIRKSRICAYVILSIGSSFLPLWQISEISGLRFHGLIVTLWGLLSWVSFILAVRCPDDSICIFGAWYCNKLALVHFYMTRKCAGVGVVFVDNVEAVDTSIAIM
jgi:hypothetical protein